MNHVRRTRLAAFLLAVLVFIMAAFAFKAENRYIGTQVHIVKQRPPLTVPCPQNFHEAIEFQGAPVAIDRSRDRIYIPVAPGSSASTADIAAHFSIQSPDYQLYFIDSAVNLQDAVRDAVPFELYVVGQNGAYYPYEVVFTGLPVVVMDSVHDLWVDPWGSIPEWEQAEEIGKFFLQEPFDPDVETEGFWESNAQWHPRGNTAKRLDKKPWKVTLKKLNGSTVETSLLGLPVSEYWILNAMNRDDTKLREQLCMLLWNELAAASPYNYPMSQGAYAELVKDGEYMGLFLLQKAVDARYLDLKPEDILIKGVSTDYIELEICNRILQSPLTREETYELLSPVWNLEDCSPIHPDNFIDVNLFLQFSCALDNLLTSNLFMVFEDSPQGYQMKLIPWDTDMTFGLAGGIVPYLSYQYDSCIHKPVERRETPAMRQLYPNWDERTAQRYAQLRKTIFDPEHICHLADTLQNEIVSSGALAREQKRWELQYAGEDTIDSLKLFFQQRIEWMDAYYHYVP